VQVQLIEQGHYIMPWIDWSNRRRGADDVERSYGEGIAAIRKWGLPLVLITGGQWEAEFYSSEEYKNLPAEETGVAVSASGRKLNAVSPFSPVEPWAKLGRKWTDNAAVKKLAELYPDVPLVLFVSNNEAHDLRWHAVGKEKNFVAKYGKEKAGDEEFCRKVLGDGFIERYGAMIKGMREGLPNDHWKKVSLFVAYNALGPDHFGRPGLDDEGFGWLKWATTTNERVSWEPYAWEGAIPESYDNHWEPGKKSWNVYSMQIEMMNTVFMRELAMKHNPKFWHEVIFWNGNLPDKDNDKYKQYAADGYPYTPERYAGWVQHNIWTTAPRVAREWRGSADNKDRWWAYFEQVIKAVDRVHNDPVLTKFWRKGELVANRAHRHPFDDRIPKNWQNVDRWFGLDTSLDPPRPWKMDTKLPVQAIARKLGEQGRREWLVYVHATMEPVEGVEIMIPDYGKIKVDAAIPGNFYHVKEADRSVTEVGK
jgi:hypothetical protein